MTWINVDLCTQVENQRRADMRRNADTWRLLRKGKCTRLNRATQYTHRLLCAVGRWMVKVGRVFQGYATYGHDLSRP